MITIKSMITDIMLLPAVYSVLDALKEYTLGVAGMVFLGVVGSGYALYSYLKKSRLPGLEAEAMRAAFNQGETLIARMSDGRCYKISKQQGWVLEGDLLFLGEQGVDIACCRQAAATFGARR